MLLMLLLELVLVLVLVLLRVREEKKLWPGGKAWPDSQTPDAGAMRAVCAVTWKKQGGTGEQKSIRRRRS